MRRADNLSNYGVTLTRVATGEAPVIDSLSLDRASPAVQAAVPLERWTPWQDTVSAYSADYPGQPAAEPASTVSATSLVND